MSRRVRSRTPKRTLSTRLASAPNETSFYEEIPATDVYYREYFDGGMVLTHEDREKVGSAEHSIRVEITERYGTGFSRGKLAAAQETRKGLLGFVSFMSLMAVVGLLAAAWMIRDALPTDTLVGMLPVVEAVGLVVISGLVTFVTVRDLYRLYQLRAVGRLTPIWVESQTQSRWVR